MKRILALSTLVFVLFMVCSCNNTVHIPKGVTATKDFSVCEYVSDNAVFKEETPLIISGFAQPGVIIVCELLDSKSNIVYQTYAKTDSFENWNLKIESPNGSFKSYKLKLYDENKTFIKQFENIRFGRSYLLIGDGISNGVSNVDEKLKNKINNNQDYMIYKNNIWNNINIYEDSFAYSFMSTIIDNTNVFNQMPISIVDATSSSSFIYEWISSDIIDLRKPIKDYLIESGLYVLNEDLHKGQMSYNAMSYFEPISELEFDAIIWNQGIKDVERANSLDSTLLDTLYNQMFFCVLTEFEKTFTQTKDIIVIQEQSSSVLNTNSLRNIQSATCNYFTQCTIVPTYDLANIKNESGSELVDSIIDKYPFNEGIKFDDLSTRIYNILTGKKSVPTLKNTVKILNKDKQVESIKLIFDSLFDFDKEEIEEIIGLSIYDEFGGIINAPISLINNEIIIDLVYVKKEIVSYDDNLNPIYEETIAYYEPKTIKYAQDDIIYDNNLSSLGIAVVPFIINF